MWKKRYVTLRKVFRNFFYSSGIRNIFHTLVTIICENFSIDTYLPALTDLFCLQQFKNERQNSFT